LTTSKGHVISEVRIPAQAPATAFFELGVRLCRSIFDGVDDGDGIFGAETGSDGTSSRGGNRWGREGGEAATVSTTA